MGSLRVAIVSRDEHARAAAARACDDAPRGWDITLDEAPPDDVDVLVFGPDVEGDGVRFDPGRPEELIEAVRAAAAIATRTVAAVVGASGGVGATTLSLHLARALSGSVCVIEAGEWCGLRARLGLADEPVRTWADVDGGDVLACALPVAGFRVLLAPEQRPVPAEVLSLARSHFDQVVVDAGVAARSRPPVPADVHLLLVAPTASSVTRARASMDARAARWTVVTSRTVPGGEMTRARIEASLGRRVTLDLPYSAALRREEEGRSVSEIRGRWGWKVRALGRALKS